MQREENLLRYLHHSQNQTWNQNQNLSFLPCSLSLAQAGCGEASQIARGLCKPFFFSRKGEVNQKK